MIDFCKHVDVFLGNGKTDRIFDDGLASKWFYIKALCGNTTPHAVLPFGKMSVGAYSGGYPSGYGMHYPNSCGGIKTFGETHTVRGFSHLHHSGTGGIRYYYNYAITTPFLGDISNAFLMHPLEKEEARPGYYKAEINKIKCELTVDGGVALHRYTFSDKCGRVAIDFSNNGLDKIFGEKFYSDVKCPEIKITGENEIAFCGTFSGIKLYFVAILENEKANVRIFDALGEKDVEKDSDMPAPFGAVWDFPDETALLRLAYSTVSYECARESVRASKLSFDEAAKNAYEIWNRSLSLFTVECDSEEMRTKFYSNLYHSLIKPVDMTGESILGVEGDVVAGFTTFWDQYKTVLPLIYLAYPEMSQKIAKGIVNVSRTLGKIPCSFGLSNVFPCEEQAKMLGIFSLCDAYYMGICGIDIKTIEECIERELERKDFKGFLENGYFDRYTHIIDVTDACLCVAELTENADLREKLLSLALNWKNAYDTQGLMSELSRYYEGDRYNYSFRLQKNIEERIALAGGKESFLAMLDSFFGFSGESLKQLTYVDADKDIAACAYHRFEGFNNESDMETPYAYIFIDRHDRLCEIIHECVHRSFGLGTGGIPGNNDSGGLSSLFIWNTLGIFPLSGSGEFLLGVPQINSAEIKLSSGNVLRIEAMRNSSESIYVDSITWNGNPIDNYKIKAKEIMNGGVLRFFMK